jgi:predicted RNA binding protein YcfA (HicA-like mRNA interferase family)
MAGGSMRIYKKGTNRVSVHYHPKKTYGERMLRGLLKDIGWTDDDCKRLKIAK